MRQGGFPLHVYGGFKSSKTLDPTCLLPMICHFTVGKLELLQRPMLDTSSVVLLPQIDQNLLVTFTIEVLIISCKHQRLKMSQVADAGILCYLSWKLHACVQFVLDSKLQRCSLLDQAIVDCSFSFEKCCSHLSSVEQQAILFRRLVRKEQAQSDLSFSDGMTVIAGIQRQYQRILLMWYALFKFRKAQYWNSCSIFCPLFILQCSKIMSILEIQPKFVILLACLEQGIKFETYQKNISLVEVGFL